MQDVTSSVNEERFWAKVKKTPTCWEWQGDSRAGYGVVRLKRENGRQPRKPAHRVAYEMLVGPIPEGLVMDHTCHNKACVNPDHLRPVTNKQNSENLSGPHPSSTSGYRGVHWKSREQRWLVAVRHYGKMHYGGYFTDKHEAGKAAQALRLKLFTHSDMDKADSDAKAA